MDSVQQELATLRQRVAELEQALAAAELAHTAAPERYTSLPQEWQRERQFFNTVLNNMADGILACDTDGVLNLVNQASRTLHGLPNQPLPPDHWTTHFTLHQTHSKTPLSPTDHPLFRALSGETVSHAEAMILPKNGEPARTVQVNAQPFYDTDGNLLGAVCVTRDITQQKQAEQEQARLSAIIEATPDFIGTATPDGCTRYMNQGAYRMLGLSPDTPLQDRPLTVNHPEWANHIILTQGLPHAVRIGSWVGETAILTVDGQEIPVSQLIIAHKSASGEVEFLSTIARDISERVQLDAERKQAELILQQNEKKYQQILDAITDMVLVKGAESRIVWANKAFREYYGMDNQQLQNLIDAPFNNPDYTLQYVRDDAYVFKTGKTLEIEEPVTRYDGVVRQFSTVKSALRNEQGEVFLTVGVSRDVTERHQTEVALRQSETQLRQQTQELQRTLSELQRTQSQLVQSEKMSSLGQLVAGVAHEINNPVNFIYGNLSHANEYTRDLLNLLGLYQQHYPNPHAEIVKETDAIDLEFLVGDMPKLIHSMRVGAERIQKIVASLRTFSRMDEAEFKAVDIHEGIDSTLMILQNRLKAKSDRPEIKVLKEYDYRLPAVECYAGQLNQVFMNILSNAIDALEEACYKPEHPMMQAIAPPQIRVRTELAGSSVIIYIIDNGPGIPETVRQRLFDPFFTTKPVGKGTGMGLSISYQVISECHGGILYCNSTPGDGAEFVIQIPLRQR